jgi:putative iron-dependent peroxidase
MFIGDPPGSYDRLLDFSTAVTGSTFFVPTAGLLEELAEPAEATEEAARGADGQPPAGSLGIGSLRHS